MFFEERILTKEKVRLQKNTIICILFSDTNKAYVALQGLDQVGIVDVTSGEIDIVEIDYFTIATTGNATDFGN